MNYGKIYRDLVFYRFANPYTGPDGELHHVQPRCMGGGDEPGNLVRVSVREHLHLHLLLFKIHRGNHIFAVTAFAGRIWIPRWARQVAARTSARINQVRLRRGK